MLPSSLPPTDFFWAGRGEPALRWGVIGAGWIAGYFVDAVQRHTGQHIHAVAARSAERTAAFAAAHGIARALTVDELIDDRTIDVIYIAAPQNDHLDLGLRAIAAGAHVLIEKPLATDAADAQRLVTAARSAGVLLMEAMWTRYLPYTLVLRRLIEEGILGDIHSVSADHGQAIASDPAHRLLTPGTGGGALLDLGIYPVQFDSMILGSPDAMTVTGSLHEGGVDAESTLVLRHGRHQSTLQTSLLTRTPTVASVCGSEARVEIDGPFHIPTGFALRSPDIFEKPLRFVDSTTVDLMDGLAWEATALATYVGEGRLESPLHPHSEVVSILATIDEARAALGAR